MKTLDSKHYLEGEQIVKTSNGIPIDLDDEPVFLLRARDKLAVDALFGYWRFCKDANCTSYQMQVIEREIQRFQVYAHTHPKAMKQPGSTAGKQGV